MNGYIGHRSGNSAILVSFETFCKWATAGMVVIIGFIAVAIYPLWLIGPWGRLGFLAALAAWWIIGRPIAAYRKAKRS